MWIYHWNIDNIKKKKWIESRNLVCVFVIFLGGGDYCYSRHCVNTGYKTNAELFFYFKHSPSKGQHSHQNNIRESHYLLTRSHFQICHGMIEQSKNKLKPRRRHFFLVRVWIVLLHSLLVFFNCFAMTTDCLLMMLNLLFMMIHLFFQMFLHFL